MKGKWNLTGPAAGIGLLLLIFDGRLALEGAGTGLELCIRTVIPSLFPFLVLSMVLTRNLDGSSPLMRSVAKALGIPGHAASLLIPAFLGGYPVGARCVCDLYRTGQIKKEEAQRLLAFCSNAGPAFFFGMVSGFFQQRERVWLLWLIHLASALLTGLSFPSAADSPDENRNRTEKTFGKDLLPSAMEAMGLICCWVILFRCLTAFLDRWCLWLLPAWLRILVTGFLELTNGCLELPGILQEDLRFVICGCMLSFGSICVLMQTLSVTKGLSLRYYLPGKLMQTFYCLLLSLSVISPRFRPILLLVLLIPPVFRKIQKSSGKIKLVPV